MFPLPHAHAYLFALLWIADNMSVRTGHNGVTRHPFVTYILAAIL
jgi:hypothetical protein